jgi:voltage-gated sodium channel
MYARCDQIAESDTFERFTLVLILLNAALLGVDTNPQFSEEYGELIFWTLWGSQIYFIGEIVVRILAKGPRFGTFFSSFWNRFDFIIVGLSLIPAVGPFVTVARLLRLLRVLRLMTVSDRLRGFLVHTQRSIDEALYFGLIGGVMLYVFAVAGVTLFAEIDPTRWGGLGVAAQSLLYLGLLQDIPETVAALSTARGSAIAFLFLFGASALFILINTIAAVTAQHLESRGGEAGADD